MLAAVTLLHCLPLGATQTLVIVYPADIHTSKY